MDFGDSVSCIQRFLPASFGTTEADEYIQYVASACNENYSNEKYQFSFLAFHLLYMCYIYKELWQGHQLKIPGLEEKIKQKCTQYPYDSPFRLSVVPEKEIIPFLNHLGFHQNKTKEFSYSVEWRDNCAHASGIVQYDKNKINSFIQQVLSYIDEIHLKKEKHLAKIFMKHFSEKFNPDDKSGALFPSGITSVKTFVKKYLLSSKDVEQVIITNIDIMNQPSNTPERLFQKVFWLLLLGWLEAYYEVPEGFSVERLIDKLAIGIDKKKMPTIGDLLQNELVDITPLLKVDTFAKYSKD